MCEKMASLIRSTCCPRASHNDASLALWCYRFGPAMATFAQASLLRMQGWYLVIKSGFRMRSLTLTSRTLRTGSLPCPGQEMVQKVRAVFIDHVHRIEL